MSSSLPVAARELSRPLVGGSRLGRSGGLCVGRSSLPLRVEVLVPAGDGRVSYRRARIHYRGVVRDLLRGDRGSVGYREAPDLSDC